VLRGTGDLEVLTPRGIGVKEYKLLQGKKWNAATSVDVYMQVSVDMAPKNAMGMELRTTRLPTALRRCGDDKVTHQVRAREPIQSRREAVPL